MTGNKKIVHFLAASDRINYGDLLFPIIFKKVAENKRIDLEFYNYGIIESNLSYFGALPTLSYKKFQLNIKKLGGNIVVGGGEVLFVDWGSLLAFISSKYSKLLFIKIYSDFERKFNLTKYFLSNGNVLVPFAPNRNELKVKEKIKIFYNSVGGTFNNSRLKNKEELFKDSLKSSDIISVRDLRVKKSLLEYGINSSLVPDSALIISEIFKKESLYEKISFEKTICNQKYFFLQLGKFYGPRNLNKFCSDLEILSNDLKIKFILCPIGLAPRHEDTEILKKISNLLKKSTFIMPKSIYDIMFLIANSQSYLGTSLHGLITAQSYNVPFIPLNKQLIKVEEYCKTWTFDLINENLDFDNILYAKSIVKNWNLKYSESILISQKKLVYENFDLIFNNLI